MKRSRDLWSLHKSQRDVRGVSLRAAISNRSLSAALHAQLHWLSDAFSSPLQTTDEILQPTLSDPLFSSSSALRCQRRGSDTHAYLPLLPTSPPPLPRHNEHDHIIVIWEGPANSSCHVCLPRELNKHNSEPIEIFSLQRHKRKSNGAKLSVSSYIILFSSCLQSPVIPFALHRHLCKIRFTVLRWHCVNCQSFQFTWRHIKWFSFEGNTKKLGNVFARWMTQSGLPVHPVFLWDFSRFFPHSKKC